MTTAGRPVRFLILLVGVWIAARVIHLSPDDVPGVARNPILAANQQAAVTSPGQHAAQAGTAQDHADSQARSPEPANVNDTNESVPPLRLAAIPVSGPAMAAMASVPMLPTIPSAAQPEHSDPARSPATITTPPTWTQPGALLSTSSEAEPGAQQPRFAGSGWLIVRRGTATPFVPQLGGSQAGLRMTYAVDAARRLALAGRLSSALAGREREGAIGIDWRPTSLPIRIVAEQRIGIDGIRGGPALGVVGGFGPRRVAGAFQIDGYGQAGAIARDRVEGYADGAMRLSHPVASIGPARMELDLGLWGGAQRGAARLDAGPAAALIFPIGDAALRLSLEWRERLAGNATPESGPSLSIGTDF